MPIHRKFPLTACPRYPTMSPGNSLIPCPRKHSLAQHEPQFLRHLDRSSPEADNLCNSLLLSTVKDLQQFLSAVNYFHRFILHVAQVLWLLCQAMAGKSRKSALNWITKHHSGSTTLPGSPMVSSAMSSFPLSRIIAPLKLPHGP